MKYLKLLLLLLVFCLTGCDVTYNLTITDDEMIESVDFWYDDTKENEKIIDQYLSVKHQAYFNMDTSVTNNYNQTSSFKPDWTLINDTENGIAYYKFNLPTEFQASGVYTIQMNLYAGNTLVGQIDTTYIYEQPEQEESQG